MRVSGTLGMMAAGLGGYEAVFACADVLSAMEGSSEGILTGIFDAVRSIDVEGCGGSM